MSKQKMLLFGIAATVLASASLLAMTVGALATPIVETGNNPQSDEQNILFKTNQTGSTVDGFTNQTNTQVDFSSTVNTLSVTANGQADLTSTTGVINNLSIYLGASGTTFGDLIIDPHKALCSASSTCTGNNTENAKLTIVATDGTFTQTLSLSNGDNYYTIIAGANEGIESVTIDDTSADGMDYFGFEDAKQIRISGLSGTIAVPEPGALSILGFSLLGLVGFIRKASRFTDIMRC